MARQTAASDSSNAEHEAKYLTAMDVEGQAVAEAHLQNTSVSSIVWKEVTVTVKDRETKLPKALVENVSGVVEAGTIRTPPNCCVPGWRD